VDTELKFTGSIARSTLIKIAVPVALVILLMTAIAFFHVVSVVTEKSLEQLRKTTIERGQQENMIYTLAEGDRVSTADQILERSSENNPRSTYSIIFRNDGHLIAHTEKHEENKRADGYYDIAQSSDDQLKRIYRLVVDNLDQVIIKDIVSDHYLAVTSIDKPGWYLVTVYPSKILTYPAFESARIIVILGITSLLLELLVIFWILRINVATKLRRFVTAVDAIRHEKDCASFNEPRNDELGELGKSINAMSLALADRTKKLEDERNNISNILDTAGALVVVLDHQGRITRFNKACEKATGYTCDEVEGKYVWDMLLLPEDIYPVKGVFSDLTREKLPNQYQNHWLAKDGNKILIDWSNTVIVDDSGRVSSVISLGQDVTEQQQMQAALAASEKRFKRLAESSPAGIFQTDVEGNCVYVNNAWCEIAGLTSGEAAGEGWKKALFGEDRERVMNEWNISVIQNTSFRSEYRFKNKKGKITWVYGQVIAETDQQGRITGYVGTITDITEQKNNSEKIRQLNMELEDRVEKRTRELEQSIASLKEENKERRRVEHLLIEAKNEAEKANQHKSDFLRGMSDELRAPLNAILGFGQLLEEGPLPDPKDNYVDEIMIAGHSLLDLVNEVLELTKIEAGDVGLVMGDFLLQDLVQESIDEVTNNAEQCNFSIQNFITSYDDLYVHVDRTRFKEAIINLLSNAARYTREDGKIILNCEMIDANTVRINVIDDGPGIPEENLKVIFEPFNRQGAESGDADGAGVGLTISKQLIELMNGSIGVASVLGKGSIFWIECKTSDAGADKSENSASSNPGVMNVYKKILYVEDNPANLRLVESILERFPQVQLLSALDAEYGLKLARAHIPDLVILDINLPGMDGYQALTRLRNIKETSDIPVFALSASAMPRDVERGLAAGFQRYLTKPIQVNELVDAISMVLKDLQNQA
jgi:PAS domain S-box-containing protein